MKKVTDRDIDEVLVNGEQALHEVRYDYFWQAVRFYKAAGYLTSLEWKNILNKTMDQAPDPYYVSQSFAIFTLEPLKFCTEHDVGASIFEQVLGMSNRGKPGPDALLSKGLELLRRIKMERLKDREDALEELKRTMRE